MPYTFTPKGKHAKASSTLHVSAKDANTICRVIRKKKLKNVKRLLSDLTSRRRSLKGKYYTKTVAEINKLLESCEKNADVQGIDREKLFVYASASKGPTMRRARRKSGFGSRMKATNAEILLVERGK